ncbi:MAG TPA: peptidylprolyl isomerase [Longimicrobium sp.]|jgi:cyclophilin family peptidyl-prolyl cis-trans isomerase/HEAT repeat protein|uniref:peptidylprolyl isomerase n=1 Tax=Longimicrobium sp. TaxID=2029185 RepID=UPI002EDADC2E
MKTRLRLIALTLLAAACAPAAPPSSGPAASARVTEAGLLRLADRREWDAEYLRAALAHRDPAVARRAAGVLANLRRAEGVALLGPALAHADTSVAAMAAFALGQIADSTAVPLLVPYADAARAERTPTVVAEVAYALGKIRHADARAALERLLATLDSDGPGNNRVAGAALLSIWRQGRPAPVGAIERWIRHADPEIRWRAAYALARRPEPAATALLFRSAEDPDALVRSFVARGLTAAMADSSGVGQEAAQRALVRMSRQDSAEIVRISALRSLGSFRTDTAVAVLANTALIAPPYETIVAMESLQRLGTLASPAVRVLRDEALDADMPVFVRQTALAALADIDPTAALGVAQALARDPAWRLRASAARALAHARPMPLGDLAAALRDPDGRIASAVLEEAATVAGDAGLASIRELLLQGLQHPDVIARTNALAGLARLADPATLPVVLDAYQRAQADSMNDAALAAVDAVGAIAKKDPAAAGQFLGRFNRSGDYLVRQRVETALGDSLAGAWSEPLPIETGMSEAEYARIVRGTRARPRPHALIETNDGNIEVELFADDAPLTVRSFLALAESGFFDGQEWPRVVPNFVIQGGDPRGDTSGGPGYTLRDEINRHLYLRGSLGMALSGPDTGGSQWFVTHSPQPHLDGTYTVFGRVVRGMEVADGILPGDRIIRIREVR